MHCTYLLNEGFLGKNPLDLRLGRQLVGSLFGWLLRSDVRTGDDAQHPPTLRHSCQSAVLITVHIILIDVQVGMYNVPTNQLLGCWAPLGPPTPIPSPVNPP